MAAARAAGAVCVVGYCYLDAGYLYYSETWNECGANASHLVGPHHVLFEGNRAFNADSDFTHGNSAFITHFRNHYSGFREPFLNTQNGHTVVDLGSTHGPARCIGTNPFGYWHSAVGNVLGLSGQMGGWTYEDAADWDNHIWLLGWDPTQTYGADPNVKTGIAGSILRDGNFDYVTNQIHWHGVGGFGAANGLTPPAVSTLPNSLYLLAKPSFFGANTWPWVTPQGATKTYTLPAKARWDSGDYFTDL